MQSASESGDIAEAVQSFLIRNFPQIAMHGGSAAVEAVDEETGEVWLRLGGACSGCGISPMTIQAIAARMPERVEGVTEVHVDTGFGSVPAFPGGDDGEERFPEAPF
jgi:Fe-S cluster biogenesis protein NfuA